MTHLILTRFNVGLFNRNNVDIKAWTEKRRKIFEQYTLPSVKNQHCKNFKWILLYGKHETFDNVKLYDSICHIMEEKNFDEELVEIINKYWDGKDDLITTRLDNDDAIHNMFIDRIQRIYRYIHPIGGRPLAINMPKGYAYDHLTGELRKMPMTMGSTFISMISRNPKENVYAMENTRIPKEIPTIQDIILRGWMRIIHDDNLSNKVQGEYCNDSIKEFF